MISALFRFTPVLFSMKKPFEYTKWVGRYCESEKLHSRGSKGSRAEKTYAKKRINSVFGFRASQFRPFILKYKTHFKDITTMK